jgi:FixJ family two-component response regulator
MTRSPPSDQPIVYIVDDDASVRNALVSLLQAVELEAESFATAEAFLSSQDPDRTSCLILDVRMPGVSGLNIQEELARAAIRIPIIFLTGHADVPMTVRAMKAGAVDFLTKPFRDQELLDAVQSALKLDEARRKENSAHANLRAAYETLTGREREILALVATGLMSKQIAARIGIAEITVKIHRSRVTHKMGARSLAQLLKMAQLLGIGSDQ